MAIHPDKHASLKEVAATLGVSVESARKIEIRALRKLRRILEAKGLSAADLMPEPGPDRDAFDQRDDQDGMPE